MLLMIAASIASADREGRIEPGRTSTSEVTHLRLREVPRRALCGARTTRAGESSGRECRSCARKLETARAVIGVIVQPKPVKLPEPGAQFTSAKGYRFEVLESIGPLPFFRARCIDVGGLAFELTRSAAAAFFREGAWIV